LQQEPLDDEHLHTNKHTYIHVLTYMHAYIHTYTYVHVCIHTYIHTYIQKHTYTTHQLSHDTDGSMTAALQQEPLDDEHVHAYIQTYIHTHMYVHVYVHTHTCNNIHTRHTI